VPQRLGAWGRITMLRLNRAVPRSGVASRLRLEIQRLSRNEADEKWAARQRPSQNLQFGGTSYTSPNFQTVPQITNQSNFNVGCILPIALIRPIRFNSPWGSATLRRRSTNAPPQNANGVSSFSPAVAPMYSGLPWDIRHK